MENIKEQFARLYMELDLTDDQASMIKKLQRDVDAALRQPPVMRSLLLKYQEEWKKAKANSKRTTKGGYEKVDLKECGKMEAFAMIMDDLARMQ